MKNVKIDMKKLEELMKDAAFNNLEEKCWALILKNLNAKTFIMVQHIGDKYGTKVVSNVEANNSISTVCVGVYPMDCNFENFTTLVTPINVDGTCAESFLIGEGEELGWYSCFLIVDEDKVKSFTTFEFNEGQRLNFAESLVGKKKQKILALLYTKLLLSDADKTWLPGLLDATKGALK